MKIPWGVTGNAIGVGESPCKLSQGHVPNESMGIDQPYSRIDAAHKNAMVGTMMGRWFKECP
jgi:hypothetical protein